jgi:hypothetical protein
VRVIKNLSILAGYGTGLFAWQGVVCRVAATVIVIVKFMVRPVAGEARLTFVVAVPSRLNGANSSSFSKGELQFPSK